MKAFEYETSDFQSARMLEDALCKYDLFEYENRVKPDYCNVGGVQFWDEQGEEWEEVSYEDLEWFALEHRSELSDGDWKYIQTVISEEIE